MKRGIILDVDGTLWDACAAIADSWNEYIRLYEPDLPAAATEEVIRQTCGKTMDKFAEAVFPGMDPVRARAAAEKCCVYEVEYLKTKGGRLYPYLRETLEKLREEGWNLYIVSNCQCGYIEDLIGWAQIEDLIEDFECYGRTLKEKGDNITLLYNRNHLDMAVYVGDTQGDYTAASAAGIPFIHAAYGFDRVQALVPAIQTLAELPDAAKELLSREKI